MLEKKKKKKTNEDKRGEAQHGETYHAADGEDKQRDGGKPQQPLPPQCGHDDEGQQHLKAGAYCPEHLKALRHQSGCLLYTTPESIASSKWVPIIHNT